MPDHEQLSSSPARSGAQRLRILVLILLICLIAAAAGWLFLSDRGHVLLNDPKAFRRSVATFVSHHRLIAPLLYVALYILLGVLAMPIWWLAILGGVSFGLPLGVLYSQIASTIGSVIAARFSHWLIADWFHKLEDRLIQLRKIDDTFGHNGLLVVMAVRLSHVLPFGLSNYAFGLTSMRSRDIALGTFLGGIPAAATYVALGVGGHPLSDWRYVTGLVILNAIMIVPLLVHYLWKKT